MAHRIDVKVEGFGTVQHSSGRLLQQPQPPIESWPSRSGSLLVPVSSAQPANTATHQPSPTNIMLVTDSALLAASSTQAASASAVWKMTDLPVSAGNSLPLSAHHHPHHLHPVGASGKSSQS